MTHDDPNGNDPVRRALRALAEEERASGPPPHLEAALRGRFRANRRRRRPARLALALGLPAAAALALLARQPVPPLEPAPPPPKASHRAEQELRFAEPQAEPRSPFQPLGAPLAPDEGARLLRVEVPAALETALGWPARPGREGAAVPAEVLLGDDGTARAIRFLPVSTRATSLHEGEPQ